MDELKPCPFCGGESHIEHEYSGNGFSYVVCRKCGLNSVKFMRDFNTASDKNAIEYWNRRVDNG
jgi:Lar family restriction alleviation protein